MLILLALHNWKISQSNSQMRIVSIIEFCLSEIVKLYNYYCTKLDLIWFFMRNLEVLVNKFVCALFCFTLWWLFNLLFLKSFDHFDFQFAVEALLFSFFFRFLLGWMPILLTSFLLHVSKFCFSYIIWMKAMGKVWNLVNRKLILVEIRGDF